VSFTNFVIRNGSCFNFSLVCCKIRVIFRAAEGLLAPEEESDRGIGQGLKRFDKHFATLQ
jgi:hypothetical protein